MNRRDLPLLDVRSRAATLAVVLAIAAIFAFGLSSPASASTYACTLDTSALYCAGAVAEVSVDCVIGATDYSCDVTGTRDAAGWTEWPLPGELSAPTLLRVVLCNGPGPCEEGSAPSTLGCTWGVGEGGCAAGSPLALTISEPLEGCLTVIADLSVGARSGPVATPIGLANVTDAASDSFTSCE